MNDSLDFTSYFLTDATAVDIDLPNGEPMLYEGKPVRVHVFGPASAPYAKAQEIMQREATKRVLNGLSGKSKKQEKEDPEADAKFLIAITESIENFPFPGGIDAIYRDARLKYVNDQVRNFVNDSANFFKGAATP